MTIMGFKIGARELRQFAFTVEVERDPAFDISTGRFRYRLTHIRAESVQHALSRLTRHARYGLP